MVQIFQEMQQQANPLGQALGMGLGQFAQGQRGQQRQQQKSGVLSQILSGNSTPEMLSQLDPEEQLKLAQMQSQNQTQQARQAQTQDAQEEKVKREEEESQILSDLQAGREVSPERMAKLSPTSLRAVMLQEKPVFEPTEAKLEAERVSDLATEIENDYKAYQSEEMLLSRQEKLSEDDKLSTPLMVKTLNALGLPLSILGNPDTEEYQKLENDYVRGISKIFPGGRITNYEIQTFMKTIPSLMNSKEGRAAIIRNRRLLNEGKKLRYDAYREVLKENQGIKPRNMGILIQEKIGDRMNAIESEFKEGIQKEIEKFQQPIPMKDAQGRVANIPPNMIQQALQDGFSF